MNGVFLYYNQIDMCKPSGIDKKILTQINVFKSLNIDCKLITLYSGSRKQGERTFCEKIRYRLPGSNIFPQWNYIKEFDNNNFIYFRRPPCITGYTVKILKKIKKKNPETKIIMEIPTFPYDEELKMSLKDYPIFVKDKLNRIKLRNIVDRIALISGDTLNELFGIPVIKLFNGIDLKSVKPRKGYLDDSIDLCAVAMFSKWHGYDRVISGMSEYYKTGGKRDIKLHLIGDGSELQSYKKLVLEKNLENNVIFYGMKSRKDLDELYNKMDIALDVFGMYRKNLSFASSLKSREYLAKGLPLISGCAVDVFETDKSFKYYLEQENNSSPIDIKETVDFYDKIYSDGRNLNQVIREIRDYAEKTCDISESMRNILIYLNN